MVGLKPQSWRPEPVTLLIRSMFFEQAAQPVYTDRIKTAALATEEERENRIKTAALTTEAGA